MLIDGSKQATGLLSPRSADKFIDLVIQNTPILGRVTPAKVSEAVATFPTIAMASYKTRGYGVTSSDRQTLASLNNLTQTDVSYSVKELVLGLVLQDSYVEDLGTDGGIIAEMVAKIFAKDLQYLVINGDTAASGTTDQIIVQKILDGIVKQMDAAGLTLPWVAGDSTITKKLAKLVSGAPDDILANPNTAIYISPADYTAIWDDVMNNNKTIAIRDGKIWYRGIELIEQTQLPSNRPIIGDMSNVLIPIMREVYMEAQRYPEARGWKVVLSTRLDVKLYPGANLRILAKSAST